MAAAADVKKALTGGTTKRSNPMVNKLKKELEASVASKARLRDKIKEGKATVARTGMVLVTKLETGGTLLLSSIAEGRWGKKIKLGGKFDARLVPGIPLTLAGIWLTATDHGAAPHVNALGDGFMWSYLGSVGQEIGEAWAEKAGKPAGTSMGDVDNVAEPQLSGLRELALTDSEMTSGARRAPARASQEDEHNRFRDADSA